MRLNRDWHNYIYRIGPTEQEWRDFLDGAVSNGPCADALCRLDCLDRRSVEIVALRQMGISFKDISRELCLSPCRVQQISAAAWGKLLRYYKTGTIVFCIRNASWKRDEELRKKAVKAEILAKRRIADRAIKKLTMRERKVLGL